MLNYQLNHTVCCRRQSYTGNRNDFLLLAWKVKAYRRCFNYDIVVLFTLEISRNYDNYDNSDLKSAKEIGGSAHQGGMVYFCPFHCTSPTCTTYFTRSVPPPRKPLTA